MTCITGIEIGSFASTSPSSTEINPWLLLHGVLFIINFSIVMPVASYLILRNRDKYDQIHKLLGILTLILLVLGWSALGWSSKDTGTYMPMDGSSVGLSHSATGTAARYIAVGVIVTGIIVGVMRMSPTIRLSVRIAHGVSGLALSFYGPVVVWNGWVRLAPTTFPIDSLVSTPILWMLLPIILAILMVGEYLVRRYWGRKCRIELMTADLNTIKSAYTINDILEMVKTKLVLIFEDDVIVIPPDWNHPGGNDLLYQYNGKDVTFILDGSEAFQDRGRNRIAPHSSFAFSELMKFKIGKLRLSSVRSPGGSTRPMLSRQISRRVGSMILSRQGTLLSAEGTMVANFDKIKCTIVSCDQVNKALDLPVRLYVLHVDDAQYLTSVGVGFKVRISLHSDVKSLERSYTVVDVDGGANTISFCIKLYPNGQLTGKLKNRKVSERIYLSYPNPCPLVPSVPTTPSLLVLIAAGTGMAPMISFYDKCGALELGGLLVWWVRDEDDLFFVEELKKLMNAEQKLKVVIFFTQPKSDMQQDWHGFTIQTGRISADCLKSILDKQFTSCPVLNEIAFIMSGPRGFISSAIESCQDLGIKNNRILSLD